MLKHKIKIANVIILYNSQGKAIVYTTNYNSESEKDYGTHKKKTVFLTSKYLKRNKIYFLYLKLFSLQKIMHSLQSFTNYNVYITCILSKTYSYKKPTLNFATAGSPLKSS